ncbi:MAG: chorismate-binding protein [Actinomycetota bacterium]|nr:chorismate-binding protein [Actinomycetota bacterium]MDQ2957810.1 chorismate-binding protein [Actinomycetota bacterium]
MAELAVRRLATNLSIGSLLRALAGYPAVDASTLVCLAGRWADGSVVIGWNPVRVVTEQALDALADPTPQAGGDAAAGGKAAARKAGGDTGAFGGGWIGWLDSTGTGWFGYFDRVLRRDGQTGWWLESIGGPDPQLAELAGIIEAFADSEADPVAIGTPRGTGRDQHLAAVEHAISAIRAGELYQVNICARFSATLAGSAIDLFEAGVRELRPDYAALLLTPGRTVLSLSPELFLARRGDRLRSAPIKGTRRRTVPADRLDDPAATELLHSDKDRAENIMIVDLMRNDLSRVCQPGSVRAAELLTIRPAPGVWHLVSEVRGELRPDARDAELLRAAFPPGSVTGAPKLRALELIDELEAVPRGLFTGAIGYVSPASDRSEFNVAIRTFEITGPELQLGVGGGITADSVPMAEWQECLIKAAPLLALGGTEVPDGDQRGWPPQVDVRAGLFETMLAVDGRLVGLADHLGRLGSSCLEVFGLRLPDELAGQVQAAVADHRGRQRVRLTIRPDRAPLIEVDPVAAAPRTVSLHRCPARTGSWRHKWADRSWLAGLETAEALPLFGVVGTDCVGETSRGNLAVIARPGVLRTPVLSDDVLPGITRRRLLDAALDHGWRVELGELGVPDLRTARLVVSLSSISGVLGVERLDGERLGVDDQLRAELAGWLD